MNYKIPKNQSHYIPGSNPFGNLSVPNVKGKKVNDRQEHMQKQLMQAQEKTIMLYARRLTKKDRELLQDFISKQYRLGSPIFNSLPPILKELILRLNLEGVDFMRVHTKNPFMKIYLAFSAWSLRGLLRNLNCTFELKKSSASSKKGKEEKRKFSLFRRGKVSKSGGS